MTVKNANGQLVQLTTLIWLEQKHELQRLSAENPDESIASLVREGLDLLFKKRSRAT